MSDFDQIREGSVKGVKVLSVTAPRVRKGEPGNPSHPSRIQLDIQAELSERLSIRLADAIRRRDQRANLRRQLETARDAGLRARHHAKKQHLQRQESTMPKRSGTTFGAWLLKQADRTDLIGALAADYATPCACSACDGRASRRYSVAGVREEIVRHGAQPAALAALEAAEAEWRRTTGAAA